MTEISFHVEWLDGEGITGPELAATFASLRIEVGGEPLTRVIDHRAQTTRDSIYVPLYPIAEWMAGNWWFLRFESENAVKQTTPDFRRRHSLRASAEGYTVPDLTMVTSGTRTKLQWRSGQPDLAGNEFLSTNQSIVDSRTFTDECARFIDKVIRRLVACGIASTFLQDEWAAIQDTDEEEQRFCTMSARLGWDPYDIDDIKKCELRDIVDRLGELSGEDAAIAWLADT